MAQAFRTYTTVQGKEPLLRRIVFEIRYKDGQLYLDRCGRILKQLTKDAPEWVAPDPTPQGTNVFNIRDGVEVGFSSSSASLTLDKSSADEIIDEEEIRNFQEQTDTVCGVILDELEITRFLRIGFRENYYFSFESKEECDKWSQNLGLVSVSNELYSAFAADPDGLDFGIVMKGPECRYRVGVSGIERLAQIPFGESSLRVRASGTDKGQHQALVEALKRKRQRQIDSGFAVMIDIDAFLLEPEEPDIRAFLQENVGANLKKIQGVLPKNPPRSK